MVQDGDIIELDVENRKRHLAVDDAELEKRRKSWQPAKAPSGGYARLYHDHVMQANLGVERREIFHALRLNEKLDPLNPAVRSYFGQAQPVFVQQTGDPLAAHLKALQSLEDLREQQASSLAHFDAFLIFAVVAVVLAFLVLLMKRSVAEKGAHIAAE